MKRRKSPKLIKLDKKMAYLWKAFCKIQYGSMVKLGIEGMYLNIIKGI
jgi:hypothetical protein